MLKLKILRSIVIKRTLRNLISKQKRRRMNGGKIKYKSIKKKKLFRRLCAEVYAPSKIVLAREISHIFVSFKKEIEKKAKLASQNHQILKLNFRETSVIDAPACAVLIATLDTIRNQYPELKFSVIRPKPKPADRRKRDPYDVDGVFCHIGLYKMLGFNYTSSSSQKNVKCWHFIQSDNTDGSITAPLLNELKAMGVNTKGMYSSYIEAIANAVEHAYAENIQTHRYFPIKRWWMLLAILDNELSLFVCDLGHGIPNTLEKTQKASTLKKIWERLKQQLGKPTTDAIYIKASTLIKETRTGLGYRGKGGGDIRSIIDKTPNSSLIIRSNRGMYVYNGRNKADLVKESPYSIDGTIVQWNLPLDTN
ncbi:hypothetical protein [Gallibacterium anatis]|uniref:hypothetical protein n=1 Tax=Gallibacterium anatis TaxID=750 RepID=UPI0030069D49